LRATVALFLLCLGGLAGAAGMVYGFGASTYRWRGMDVEVRIVPSLRGETRFVFAPLGEVRAQTHNTPLTLSIALEEVSFEELKRFIQTPPARAELERDFKTKARSSLTDFAARQILLGMAGALLVPLVLRLRRARYYTVPPLAAGAFIAIVFFHAAGTFNPRAFNSPTYTGSLQQANWIIALVKDGFVKADVLSERLKRVAGNLNTLYSRIQSIPGVGHDRDTIKVLHISDIHNNPAAVDFVKELAEKMQVDVVVDTGDLTDLGLPIESNLTRGLAGLKVPYLFVAGNHDSLATVNLLRANPNAVILHDKAVPAAGLTFLGAPDPSASRPGQGSVDTPEGALQSASELLLGAYRGSVPLPDVVCVHNPKQAAALIGTAKIVLCGHLHTASIEMTQRTVICNAGTTGGSGVRYFENREGVPFTAAILFFSRTPEPRLLYIDRVSLAGNFGEYSLTRKSFEPAEGPVGAPPALEVPSSGAAE
jgi:predicted phosphodiesterase